MANQNMIALKIKNQLTNKDDQKIPSPANSRTTCWTRSAASFVTAAPCQFQQAGLPPTRNMNDSNVTSACIVPLLSSVTLFKNAFPLLSYPLACEVTQITRDAV
jgi:hypothetical protein